MADNNDIKNFNSDAFASDLSSQARQVVPSDISKNEVDFIVDIIYRFCKMAGDALVGEENSKLNSNSASLVVQFIGEWIFHKSIDVIRAGIANELREGILQKVAFTVFEIAKKAIESDIPQDQLIALVEVQVKKSFEKAIAELEQKGVLSEELAKNTLSQSNIDNMAVEQAADDVKMQTECMSDDKIVKLASLAVLIKSFPSEKIKNIVQGFNKPEKDVLLKYLKIPDLEEKMDLDATIKCFEDLKTVLPETIVISYDRAYKKLYKIVKNSSKEQISTIIDNERPAIKEFVSSCYTQKRKKLPAYIADAISKYIEENVS